jgi:hypothetical protein
MRDAPTIATKNREHTDKPEDLSVPYFQKLARMRNHQSVMVSRVFWPFGIQVFFRKVGC